jgi:DNA mismatch endonuclease (patch repair protein)
MDIVSRKHRSKMMSAIRGKDTKPELLVRRAVHRMGGRFRLHRRDLPGSPDLVFPAKKLAMFVHGCFWHRHENCKFSYTPKSNVEFWSKKFENNLARDIRVEGELKRMGWTVAVVWECEVADSVRLSSQLKNWLIA